MERYLLFDSGCSVCSSLANQIEHASKGWLQARSLRDPQIQQQLDEAHPGWKWEPMLMEINAGRTHLFTGVSLRFKLLLGLGPAKTWEVAQLVGRARMASAANAQTRRGFLKKRHGGRTRRDGLCSGVGRFLTERRYSCRACIKQHLACSCDPIASWRCYDRTTTTGCRSSAGESALGAVELD